MPGIRRAVQRHLRRDFPLKEAAITSQLPHGRRDLREHRPRASTPCSSAATSTCPLGRPSSYVPAAAPGRGRRSGHVPAPRSKDRDRTAPFFSGRIPASEPRKEKIGKKPPALPGTEPARSRASSSSCRGRQGPALPLHHEPGRRWRRHRRPPRRRRHDGLLGGRGRATRMPLHRRFTTHSINHSSSFFRRTISCTRCPADSYFFPSSPRRVQFSTIGVSSEKVYLPLSTRAG